ncbi:protein DYAD-like [Forsythia ovata]|uniref:Protein DYAD-like n=1 Tax=Forsythia ovata TaxID=205694 RepID=A0ABD1WKC8_9LAMI
MELMATKKQLEEEVGRLRSERDELLSKKREEENQAIAVSSCPCGISQKLNQFTNSLVTSKPDLDSAPAISVLEKLKEQLMVISDFVKEMEVSAKAEKRLGTAAAGEKAEHLQRLKSGFRICKPQGTFLWPNMVKSNSSSPQVVVQVEVPTPTSVSSSSASAPLQILPYHRYPTSPVKPLAERRAVAVTVSTASNSPSYEDDLLWASTSSASQSVAFNCSLRNSHAFIVTNVAHSSNNTISAPIKLATLAFLGLGLIPLKVLRDLFIFSYNHHKKFDRV